MELFSALTNVHGRFPYLMAKDLYYDGSRYDHIKTADKTNKLTSKSVSNQKNFMKQQETDMGGRSDGHKDLQLASKWHGLGT